MKTLHLTLAVIAAVFICASCTKNGAVSETGEAETALFSGTASAVSGRAKAGFEAYRIAYYEPANDAAASTERGAIQESGDPFTVTAFGPQDELPSEIRRPSIYAVFSQPVVPLAKLGGPVTEDAGLFTIEPPLKGIYRWYGTKLLSFEPEADGLPQQKYTVTVSDSIQSLGGKKLEGNTSFSFETERLGVLSWSLGPGDSWTDTYSAPPDNARYITAVFSYPVELDEIAAWIEIRGGGRTYPFTVGRPGKAERGYRTRDALDDQFALIAMNGTPLPTRFLLVLRNPPIFG
jgi:hypothetical protein